MRAKRPRSDWLGPLLRYDLVAATRRGQHALLRCLAAAILLITLLAAYSVNIRGFDVLDPFRPTPLLVPNEQAAFANWFADSSMVVQLVGIFLLTPAVVADTIAREKERKTLEFLFITELTDREIVVGKLGARLAYLFGILLTGLPILALTQLFGGVAWQMLAGQYAYLISTLFVVGSISMFCSVTASKVTAATLAAYGGTLAYALVNVCCLTSSMRVSVDWMSPLWLSLMNGFAGLVLVTACVFELRPRATRRAPLPYARAPRPRAPMPSRMNAPAPATDARPRPVARPLHPMARPLPQLNRAPLPPVYEEWPLVWKEVSLHTPALGSGITSSVVVTTVLMPTAVIGAIIFFAFLAESWNRKGVVGDYSRLVVAVLTVLLGGLLGLFAMRHATSSVTREREAGTLGSLLLLPCDREEILQAKWLAGFVGWWPMLAVLGSVFLFGLLTTGVSIVRTMVLVLAVAAPLEFLASLGLWISVICATSLRANLAAILCLMLVAAGPWIVVNYVEMAWPHLRGAGPVDELVMTAAMPPVAWVQTALGDGQPRRQPGILTAVLWGSLAYACGAWLLWHDTKRRFRRLTG